MITVEDTIQLLEETANMLRGMTFDPAIPAHAKDAMYHRIETIDNLCGEWLTENS